MSPACIANCCGIAVSKVCFQFPEAFSLLVNLFCLMVSHFYRFTMVGLFLFFQALYFMQLFGRYG